MDADDLKFDEEQIKNRLRPCFSSKHIQIKDKFFDSAAVLFAIVPQKDRPYELILIRRTEIGSRHKGEMSFPGGRFDPSLDKDLKDTALRECEEEIGVPRENIKILGCLHDFPTLTRFIITAFIGVIDKDIPLIKEDKEVQEIIKVPIDFFVNTQNFREKPFDIEGHEFPIFYFHYKNSKRTYIIWGATAHMITIFIKLVYGIDLSTMDIKRFGLDKIRTIKNYIKFKQNITKKLK